jgi:hypothetical protein
MTTTSETAPRELAWRSHDGTEVALLWNARTLGLSIVVEDKHEGGSFTSDVSPGDALDAFKDPYAYRKELACSRD